MGLAASQARLLMYTARKADCELRISKNATEKMALAREQSKLTQEYHSRLNSKNLAYYANGKYHKLDYTYLMGKEGYSDFYNNNNYAKKQNYNMILTDSRGLVVLDKDYVDNFQKYTEEGKPFAVNSDAFVQILFELSSVEPDAIRKLINNQDVLYDADGHYIINLNKVSDGTHIFDKTNEKWNRISYWYPIVLAAATNGWTSEYANQLNSQSMEYAGEDYLGDGIQSGIFNLVMVQEDGTYMPDTTLSFFTTTNEGIVENMSSDVKEKLTAWYNAEHDRINEKETYLDLENTDLSTELEAIKTAIQSIESYTQDAITSIFDWGSG